MPSSAVLPFFAEGSRLQEKVGTLILTSLLEDLVIPGLHDFSGCQHRSPSSALLLGGGFPYQNGLQEKVSTLILTSLLEDLVIPGLHCMIFSGCQPRFSQ